MSYHLFIQGSTFLVSKTLTIDIRYDNFDLLNKLKFQFCIIFVNFEDTKMEDNAFKIPRPGVMKMPHGSKTENDVKVVTKF